MKTRVTLRIDADLLRQARALATEQGRSLPSLLVDVLSAIVRERKDYDAARRRALKLMREAKRLGWKRPKSRDELHER
jgi:hypothetical protein